MSTTLRVTEATKQELKNLKTSLGLGSVDDVIHHLLTRQSSAVEEPSGDSGVADKGGEPPRKRRRDVRPPLFSFDILTERREMLEYYTGFGEEAVQLLVERLSEVSKGTSFFSSR